MFDFLNSNDSLLPDTTDKQNSFSDFSGGQLDTHNTEILSVNTFDPSFMSHGNEYIFQHHDPLLHVNKFQFEPLNLHIVKPHFVEGYVRADGTVVDGYFRDGNGYGYLRSNPDGVLENNLNFDGDK
jgi:hypothetical protein